MEPPGVPGPGPVAIAVLLQAAAYLERRDREAEHGYASPRPWQPRRPPPRRAAASARSVHKELEQHRRAQLRRCLEQLRQQVPGGAESSRPTTLGLLHRARLHIQKLEEQERQARRLKDRLQREQRSLRQHLEHLVPGPDGERTRANSLNSSALSSERSDSDQEDAEVDVEMTAFNSSEGDMLDCFTTGREHSYSSTHRPWL